MHQVAQEGALWPSVMITLGPCWRKVRLNLALIVALSDVGSHININVTSCMAQLKLHWLSYSLN